MPSHNQQDALQQDPKTEIASGDAAQCNALSHRSPPILANPSVGRVRLFPCVGRVAAWFRMSMHWCFPWMDLSSN
jgi:hypothetical protein